MLKHLRSRLFFYHSTPRIEQRACNAVALTSLVVGSPKGRSALGGLVSSLGIEPSNGRKQDGGRTLQHARDEAQPGVFRLGGVAFFWLQQIDTFWWVVTQSLEGNPKRKAEQTDHDAGKNAA